MLSTGGHTFGGETSEVGSRLLRAHAHKLASAAAALSMCTIGLLSWPELHGEHFGLVPRQVDSDGEPVWIQLIPLCDNAERSVVAHVASRLGQAERRQELCGFAACLRHTWSPCIITFWPG